MINRRQRTQPPRFKSFDFKGGYNTEISNMERKPGELSTCLNYHVVNGAYSGYQSSMGYERFDGQTAPSTIDLVEISGEWANGSDYNLYDRVSYNGYVYYCIQASGSGSNAPDDTPDDNTWWQYEGTTSVAATETDTKREAYRTAITAPTGSGQCRGLHVFKDKVYTWRNDAASPTTTDLFVSGSSGWTQVAAAATEMSPSADVRAVTSRFGLFQSNAELMFWVDSVTAGFFYYSGSGTYVQVTHASLPATFATHIGAWENRLFLVYPGGHIFFSKTGDPSDFDASTGTAGEIYIGDDVTNIIPTAGKLIIFTRNSIKVLHYGSTTDQFIFKMDDFSTNMGAVTDTVQNMFERLYFCDDRGVTGMFTDPATGGFITEPYGQKVESEYIKNRSNITASIIDHENLRYYVFYDNELGTASKGLNFTFHQNKNKGAGLTSLKHYVTKTAFGRYSDGSYKMFFGDDSGLVYQLESGTSFDGGLIVSKFLSSYYNYGTPRHWKHFVRLGFEITLRYAQTFNVGTSYDYGTSDLPKSATDDSVASSGTSVWGSGIEWGEFVWGAGALGRAISYIYGHGTNMAISIHAESKYNTQHTIHNVTVDYTLGAQRQ